MKKFIVNIFATTGISLLLLSMTALFYQAKWMYLQTVFQVFAINIVIHSGLCYLGKLEMKHAIIEIFLHIVLIMVMLIAFGCVFHWYTSTPVWTLVAMGFAVYSLSAFLNLLDMKREAKEINALIKKNSKKGQ